jgi:hypothetical protein
MAQNEDEVFEIYKNQYSNLLKARGVSQGDIDELLMTYSQSGLHTDADVARMLGWMYSRQRGIGVLFYFFNNDSLRRAFYVPGRVVEVSTIGIKKEELLEIGADINNSLNLYSLSAERRVTQRGASLHNLDGKKRLSFNDAIARASAVLFPRKLDSSFRHLLIIPALNIGTIPFGLLRPFQDSSFLIDRCSYTLVPSLIDLVALRTRVLKKASGWDGSRFDNDFDDEYVFRDIDSNALGREMSALFVCNPKYPESALFAFPDLPGAEKEIDMVLPFARSAELLKGEKATKKKVLDKIEGVDMAYFATHGVADQEDPMGKSFLVLSGESPFLTAAEIMHFMDSGRHLPPFVVLSACQTGLGKSMEAGTAGLARSFLLGGSSHVVVSLWNVDDAATAYLMSRFILHLQEPHRFSPSEPLRLAMLDAREKYPMPAQWASFALFGIDY